MRWWIDFNRLSEKQKLVLSNIRNQDHSSHWLQGFAGTGKTLILLHLMEQMANIYPQASMCFITYTNTLTDLIASAPPMAAAGANRFIIQTHTKFLSAGMQYDYVFLDEVQDIKLGDLTKIKKFAGKLYIAGDPDQRIYDSDLTTNGIINLLNPQINELTEVFRLTARLRQVARSILPEARLVEGLPDDRTNGNASIHVMHADNVDNECAWVWKEALAWAKPGDPSVILFPHHDTLYDFADFLAKFLSKPTPPKPAFIKSKKDYSLFNEHWKNNGIPLMYLGNGFGSLSASDHQPVVYLMTYHSAKGLDFKSVFIPFLNADTVIINPRRLLRNPGLDRRLLFVAVTRSRENLFLTYSGNRLHHLLSNLPADGVTRAEIGSPTLNSGVDEVLF